MYSLILYKTLEYRNTGDKRKILKKRKTYTEYVCKKLIKFDL